MATEENAKKPVKNAARKAAARKTSAKKVPGKKVPAKKTPAKKTPAKKTRPSPRSIGDLSAYVNGSWLSLTQLISHQDVLGLSLFVDLKSTALSDDDKSKIEAFVTTLAKNPWAICKKPQ